MIAATAQGIKTVHEYVSYPPNPAVQLAWALVLAVFFVCIACVAIFCTRIYWRHNKPLGDGR